MNTSQLAVVEILLKAKPGRGNKTVSEPETVLSAEDRSKVSESGTLLSAEEAEELTGLTKQQQEFVEWWDATVGPGQSPGRGNKTVSDPETVLSVEEAEKKTGFTKVSVSRIRKKLSNVEMLNHNSNCDLTVDQLSAPCSDKGQS